MVKEVIECTACRHITLTSSVLDPKGEGGSPFTSSAGSPTPTTGFGFAPLQEPVQDTRRMYCWKLNDLDEAM